MANVIIQLDYVFAKKDSLDMIVVKYYVKIIVHLTVYVII
jgi:hypothetical protein